MTEFRVGDKVQVEMPRGYSKRGVLGISVMFTTSPEARFENAVGTIKEINPLGPHSVHQYLVDFRPFDNSRLGIPWQAHWFREEWISLVERPGGQDLPPTPSGPGGGAEDSVGPFAKGASPGGDDRTPEQAAQERERLAEPRAVADTGSGSGTDPAGPEPATEDKNTNSENISGIQHAGDVLFTRVADGDGDSVLTEAESDAIAVDSNEQVVDFEINDAVGGDRVGAGTGFLTLPGEDLTNGMSFADPDDLDVPGGAQALAADVAGGADLTGDVLSGDASSSSGSVASGAKSTNLVDTEAVGANAVSTGERDQDVVAAAGIADDFEVGIAGVTGDGTPVGVTGSLPEPAVEEEEADGGSDASLSAPDMDSSRESMAEHDPDAEDAGFAAMATAGLSVAASVTAAGEDDTEVVAGGAVDESELGAATNAAVLAAPGPTTPLSDSEPALSGYVRVSGERDCPPGYPIKGNASSKIFHLPGQSSYDVTIPEICFASAEDAVAAGFRPRKGAAGAREASAAFAGMGSGPTDDDHDFRLGVPNAADSPASPLPSVGVSPAGVAIDMIAEGSAAGVVDISAGHELDDPGAADDPRLPFAAPGTSPYDDDEDAGQLDPVASSGMRAEDGTDHSGGEPGDIDTTGMGFAEALAAGARSGAGWIRGDGSKYCPDDFPIKGNANSMIHHRPADDSYRPTIPEVCFASEEQAEASGFRPRTGARTSQPQRKDKTKHRR